MKKAVSGIMLTLLILTSTLTLAFNIQSAKAAAPLPPAIWTEPASISLNTGSHGVGYKFNVTVYISTTGLTYVWQVKVHFNPAHIKANRAAYTAGGTSQFFSGHGAIPVNPIIDNTTGTVMYGESLVGSDSVKAGSGSLFWIEFEVVAVPAVGGSLHSLIDPTDPADTFILDPDLTVVPGVSFGYTTYDFTWTSLVQTWLFDSDFQYNLDDNYGTIEGTGHLSGTATLSAKTLSIEGQITLNGDLPSGVPEVYLVATDGQDKELAKQAVDLSGLSYWQTGPNTYNFTGQILNVIQPINNGHYEAQALITYNAAKYEFFVNTASLINNHYFPLTTPPPKFRIGDWVQTTANLNVREGPGLSYRIIDAMAMEALGQIVGGPVVADSYTWWNVCYDVGIRGWSAENWLTIVTTFNVRPLANFTYSPREPKAGELVTFDASDSNDTDGEILLYEWDWDDDGVNDHYSISPQAFFWWPENGTYSVGLTIIDDGGASTAVKKNVFIEPSAESRRILAGWGEESQSSAALLASWGQHPIWWATHKTEHNKLVEIDNFLREGAGRLSWLPSEFKNLEEPDIVNMLKVEMDQSLAPGLTYLDYAINMVEEAELNSQAWWQSTPLYYYDAMPLLVKYGMKTIWDAFVSESTIIKLIAEISTEAALGLGVGVAIWRMAAKLIDIRNLIDWTAKKGYCWGLGYYFLLRDNSDDGRADAWNNEVVQSFLMHSLRDGATEEQKKSILDEWEITFNRFWDNYGGKDYYDAASAHNDKGFPQELKTKVKSEIKKLIVYALEKNIALRTDRKIVSVASPVELRIWDSQGRITGSLNGEIREEIPYSVYDNETETATIFRPTDSYNYEIVGIGVGTYRLGTTSIKNGQIAEFTATDIPTSTTTIHYYTIDWDALSLGEEGVTVRVDSDGDGVFEHTFSSDSELTQSEYVIATDDIPPQTWHNIGEPKFVVNGVAYLTSATPLELIAEDNLGGSGVASTAYRIYNASYDSGWITYTEPFCLAGLSDGTYQIDYNSTDYAGNVENTNYLNVTVVDPDINGDGEVDMKDIAIAGRAFGTVPGDARWNPLADVNLDGKVDLRDIALTAKMFGKHFP
jgi:uncharacterized protein YraI